MVLIPLLLLWLGGGKGDNASVMRRLGGVIVALAIIGLAVTTDAGKNIGTWIAGLVTNRSDETLPRTRADNEVYRVDAAWLHALRAAMP